MRERIRKLIVISLIILMINRLPGQDALVALAAQIYLVADNNVTISADTSDTYIYSSGGEKTLNISSGVTVSGNIDFSESGVDGTVNTLNNSGIITGSLICGFSGANIVINNYGTINSDLSVPSGTIVNNSGTVGVVAIDGGRLVMTGGQASTVVVNAETDATPVSLSNCMVGTVNSSGNIVLEGTVGIGSLNAGSLTGNGTVNVTDYLRVSSKEDTVNINVDKTTQIVADAAITFMCGEKTLTVESGEGTVKDLCGLSVVVNNPEGSNVIVSSDEASGKTYWFDETSGIITIETQDGFWFSEDYVNNISCTGQGVFTTNRISDTKIELSYEFSTEDSADIEINLAVATGWVMKPGLGSIYVADIYYGNTPSPELSSLYYDSSLAYVEYKKADADDSTYTRETPSEVGAYVARATFPENEKYTEITELCEFSISYLPVPENAYIISGTQGNNNFYTSSVTIAGPEGYLISDTLNGDYVSRIYIEHSKEMGDVYLKKQSTGEMTGAIWVQEILIDCDLPFVDALDNEIYYGDSMEIVVSDEHLESVTVNGAAVDFEGNMAKIKLESKGGSSEYVISVADLAGNTRTINVTFAAEWIKTGLIPSGMFVNLSVGKAYKLGSGNWKVNGDSTTYSGNTTFYVDSEGIYTFDNQ